MGDKRPNQHQTDHGGAGASDFKWNPDNADEGIIEREKSELASNDVKDRESKIPRRGKNPALADLQQRREQRAREQEADKGADAGNPDA